MSNQKPEVTTLYGALQAAGAFASTELHKRSVPIGSGSADVYIREFPDNEFRKTVGEGYDRANLIAAGVCDADGKTIFTSDQAAKLKPYIARELERLIMRLNGGGDIEAQAEADDNAGKS